MTNRAPVPPTVKQEALGPSIDNQGPLTNNQGVLEALTDNQGAPGPLTDDQGAQARGFAIQIFNNIYAKPVKNLKVLC